VLNFFGIKRLILEQSGHFMSSKFPHAPDEAKSATQRRRSVPWILGGLVLVLLALIVAQQPFNLWALAPPDTAADTVVLYALSSLNFAAFVVFSFILVRSLVKLRRERRERQLGSKIKTRLVIYFIGLSLLPITAMAAFSYLFINRTVEKWFSGLPERVAARARLQQGENLAIQNRDLQESATLLATLIQDKPESQWQGTLDKLAATEQLTAIAVISSRGEILAQSQSTVPDDQRVELNSLLAEARSAGGDVGERLADGKGFDLIGVPLGGDRNLVLVPHRRSDTDVNDTIARSQNEYRHLVTRQRKVRLLGLSTLGLLTLLLLFASTWAAIHVARGIAGPIKSLAEASNEVARGNLSHRVDTVADDELALLAESFNQMTAQLEENRRHIDAGAAELKEKNLALEERRHYTETVLESLSTGVVSLDENDCVTTINAAAASMLRLSELPAMGTTLSSLVSNDDRAVLDRLLRRARRTGRVAEQAQLTLGSGPDGIAIPVALTATALRGPSATARGVVLVIEDLSDLLAAQRAAAWSEVARRVAHEIKNPLTPIQLSAERIARNFHLRLNGNQAVDAKAGGNGSANGNGANQAHAGPLSEEDQKELAHVVEECTTSITREVAGLKAMVDEFSRFARLPHLQMEPANLNEIVRQTASLYEDRLDSAELRLELVEQMPLAMLDTEQMKRVFVNLIDNGLESVANVAEDRCVTVSTRHDSARDMLVAEVADMGEGIPMSDLKRLFQPNFSTRERGTGLGLAIVQRIVTDHGGHIHAEANQPRGARFVIELPVQNREL
jgi:PAS domain S-box-containing protein